MGLFSIGRTVSKHGGHLCSALFGCQVLEVGVARIEYML